MNMSMFEIKCGVYKITNKINGRIYVGKSVYLQKRWAEHAYSLCTGRHETPRFLADFQLHGLGAFDIEIIEECDKDALTERESYWLLKLRSEGANLYNTTFPRQSTIPAICPPD